MGMIVIFTRVCMQGEGDSLWEQLWDVIFVLDTTNISDRVIVNVAAAMILSLQL